MVPTAMHTFARPSLLCALLLCLSPLAHAQAPDVSAITLKNTAVAGTVSVIEGVGGFAGGNVGVSIGEDGVFLIDDEIEPMSAKLLTFVKGLSKKPLRFLLNTHWHGDHAGGNAAFGAAGAVVIAHDNVRKRLSADQFAKQLKAKEAAASGGSGGASNKAPAPATVNSAALPIVTFSEDVTLHLNGDEVHAFHVPPAHTDGDVVIHFRKANVIHMGDLFIAGGYPYVDIGSGGTFDGFIVAADKALAVADDATRIIPGHGPVVGKAQYKAWRDMLVTLRGKVVKLRAQKKSLAEVQAAKPGADTDATFGTGFIKPDQIIEAIYKTAVDSFKPKAP
jgi:cyclase